MRPSNFKSGLLVPAAVALLAVAALAAWMASDSRHAVALRVPGTDQAPGLESGNRSNAVLSGKLIVSKPTPAGSSGAWPGFRGKDRDDISKAAVRLSRSWESS